MGYTRKYDPMAYAICDPKGKALLTNYLNSQGIFTLAKEDYKADIASLKPTDKDRMSFHEVELKPGWTGEWPDRFLTIDIPYRKHALLYHHQGHSLTFWVVAGDNRRAWKVPCTELTEDRVAWKWTPRNPEEPFYRIPLECCELVRLKVD